jgi:hypothetical protein
MSIETRDIVEHSISELVKEVAALTLDGWAISPTCPGDVLPWGNSYTVTMMRSQETVEKFRSLSVNVGDKPKLTRAEILQKARDAKKVKLDISTIR